MVVVRVKITGAAPFAGHFPACFSQFHCQALLIPVGLLGHFTRYETHTLRFVNSSQGTETVVWE